MLYRRAQIGMQFLLALVLSHTAMAGSEAFSPGECEDTRYTYVRYGDSYAFFHELTNSSSMPIYIVDKTVRFIDSHGNAIAQGREAGVIQPGSPFVWTPDLVAHDYAIDPGSTVRTIITEPTNWRFSQLPARRNDLRRNEYDFIILYKISYRTKRENSKPADLQTRVACNYYATTWCGDGVIDTDFRTGDNSLKSEDCDDGNQFNGDGCSAGCRLEG